MKSPEPQGQGKRGAIKQASPQKSKANDVAKAKPNSSSKLPSTEFGAKSKPRTLHTPPTAPAQDLIPARNWDEAELAEPSEVELEQEVSRLMHAALQPPGRNLTLDLVIKRHALDEQTTVCNLARAEFIHHMTRLHLDRLNLIDLPVEVVQAMPCLTHVYLQHNRITSMAALAALPKLMFAALGHNQIQQVQGVSQLTELMMLDVSSNQLTSIQACELPGSIRFLKIADNPCTRDAADMQHVRQDVLQHLPLIRDLDGPLSSDDSESDDESETGGSPADDESETGLLPESSDLMSRHSQQGPNKQLEAGGDVQVREDMLSGDADAAARPWRTGGASRGIGSHLGNNDDTSGTALIQQQPASAHTLDGTLDTGDAFITSALDMLEALERGCANASMSILNASVKLNASRAATTTNHIQMRASVSSSLSSRPVTPAALGRPDHLPASAASPTASAAHNTPAGNTPATAGLSPRVSTTLPGGPAQAPSPVRPLSSKRSLEPLSASPSLSRLESRPSATGLMAASQSLNTIASLERRQSLSAANKLNPGTSSLMTQTADARSLLTSASSNRTDLASQDGTPAGRLLGQATRQVDLQVAADLAMLRVQLERLVEPLKWAADCVAAAAEGLGDGEVEAGQAAAGPSKANQPTTAAAGSAGSRPSSSSSSSRPGSNSSRAAATRPASGSKAKPKEKSPHKVPVPGPAVGASPGASVAAVPDTPGQSLLSQLDRMLLSAAARVSEQRTLDATISDEIRSLKQSISIASEFKSSLNLKSAMALGTGAVAAVRSAVDTHGPITSGAVRSAIEQHVTAEALRGPDAAAADDVSMLRASLARLGKLSTAVMVEHGADLEALQALSNQGVLSNADGDATGDASSADGSDLARNKYYRAIQARAAAAAGMSTATIEEDVDEGEDDEVEEGEDDEVEEGVQGRALVAGGIDDTSELCDDEEEGDGEERKAVLQGAAGQATAAVNGLATDDGVEADQDDGDEVSQDMLCAVKAGEGVVQVKSEAGTGSGTSAYARIVAAKAAQKQQQLQR